MNAKFRQKLKRKKNEKYEHEKNMNMKKIRIFKFGNAFEYSLEIRIFECSNIRSHPYFKHWKFMCSICPIKHALPNFGGGGWGGEGKRNFKNKPSTSSEKNI